METLFVNHERLGYPYVGTRNDFRQAFRDQWPVWNEESESELPLSEWIEQNLDENLTQATADDLAKYPRI
jgi:predicted component of type VI protein secretion system